MKDLYPFLVNLPTFYVSTHKQEIREFFRSFDEKTNIEYTKLLSSTKKLLKFRFNKYGGLIIPLSKIDKAELYRLQLIENSYFGCPFFKKLNNTLINRGGVFYASSIIEKHQIKSIRLISMVETSLDLSSSFLSENIPADTYSMVSLVDDIRYKAILLYDFMLSEKNEHLSGRLEKIVNMFSLSFYKLIIHDYDEYVKEIENEIKEGIRLFKDVLNVFTNNYDLEKTELSLKTYKESDNPVYVWMLIKKLNAISPRNIQTIVGIRFGGIELPYLIKEFLFPGARVCLVKISTYTDQEVDITVNPKLISSRNILVVDDNILTGRTLSRLFSIIKLDYPKNMYFACFSYSGMKRYPQMIMEGHGLVNHDILENSCVITQSDFTTMVNSKSYKNKNGVFDKTKKDIQQSLDSNKTFMFKI